MCGNRQCGNQLRQCGNAAIRQKFINKNFHKKQIFVTNNPKILQISLRLFDEKYLQKYKTLSTINSSTVAPLEANHISGSPPAGYWNEAWSKQPVASLQIHRSRFPINIERFLGLSSFGPIKRSYSFQKVCTRNILNLLIKIPVNCFWLIDGCG